MLKKLIKLADRLDELGRAKEANKVDQIIRKIAQDEGDLWDEENMTISPLELVEHIKMGILVRAGEEVTEELAEERARNIVTPLMGYKIGG